MELSAIVISIAAFALVSLWGINLWELRALRKDNKELTLAIGHLSNTIVALQTELAHKQSTEKCAELRAVIYGKQRHN